MKKSLLLLMLLPIIGFAQNASELLVRWEGTRINWSNPSTQPMYYNSSSGSLTSNGDITAGNASGSGISFNSGEYYTGFRGTGWDHSNNPNYNKYFEFTLTANSGKQIEVKNLEFDYKGYCKHFKVVYQKSSTGTPSDNSFYTASVLTTVTNANSNNIQKNVSLTFPSNYQVLAGETLYIRIYGYKVKQNNNKWFLVHNNQQNNVANANSVGPAIYGVISNYSSTLTAVDDSYSVNINNSGVFDVLNNDIAGNSAINYITLASPASNGTAQVNGDNTITYTPSSGYAGNDSFTYTIGNGTDPNDTATVTVAVQGTTPVGPLNGTYYVGNNGHFSTITSAVEHLNANGVSGPVTFLLNDALYNNDSGEVFPITINSYSGSSAVNTVTFKPNTGVNASVESNNINGYTGVPAVFKLNGADNIIFDGSNQTNGTTRNLTINNKDDVDYVDRAVIWIASNGSNGAKNNVIKYCNIRQANKNSSGRFTFGVYSGGNSINSSNGIDIDSNTPTNAAATANNANINVTNNDFTNVKQGVYINGGSSPRTTGVVIHQNDLGVENNTETIIQPTYLSNVNGFEFTENFIYNLYRDNNSGNLISSGIYVENNTTNGFILKNDMKDFTKLTTDANSFAGIILASTNNNSNILVANNFVLNVAGNNNGGLTGNGYGISVLDGGDYKIYHNTVVLNTAQSGNGQGYSAALRVSSGVNLDVRNNIFVNNQTNTNTRRCSILVDGDMSMFSYLDYNNLFSADKIGYTGNNPTFANDSGYQTTLSGWQSASGKDTNSINESPVFVSASDLHLDPSNNDSFNNLGTPLADVVKDIDGQLRNTTTPDMGADEFGPIVAPEPETGEGIYCDSSVTWNGTAWVGGSPTADTDVIFSGDYTQNGSTLYACSIFVIDGANVVFENNSDAIVTNIVSVEEGSSLTFESSCNLIQIENVQNDGTVTIKRNSSKIKRLDYTIWSSPVAGTQTLLDFSPQTITNRFYSFATADNLFFSITDPASTTFDKGKGYLIRVANNHSDTVPTVYNGEFEGTPNNGNVRVAMEHSNGDQSYNIVGNPYPSPINITKFIDGNIDTIDGTIWVWRKTNDATKTTYCVMNKLGYVANDAPGGGGVNGDGGNDLIADPFSIIEEGVLNTGQGFFVRALNDNDLVFRNNMREDTNYDNFFRSQQETTAQVTTTNSTSRYWINVVTEDESTFSQMLVAHSSLTTDGYDNGYDGRSFLDGGVSLYTILEGATEEENINLAIQSRKAFDANASVRVGFETEIAGSFKITIDHMDGIFEEGQSIYLIDRVTNTTHELTSSDYTFDSEIGTFDNRFEIVYTTEVLSTEVPQLTKDDVVVFQNNKQLSVNATQNMESVVIYDLLGKVIYQNTKVDSTEFTTTLNIQQQVAIVMITLENNQVVSKKIMVN
ncbi:Ig-like domain-containing protein [Flavobacterium litorale]|uniref:Cadherin-like domain-containing protein n=1 Tax=Flavobacterium litorale TaxID=2856519 RepID=A0ABX8VDJ5_9FLAO|nr:Ig-like domain-containing protein [Flavobacterium litorale]QYJ69223.1 cadherin-like domain-containing protein [Flavobacterium litorale]